jgi:hypothetical protein
MIDVEDVLRTELPRLAANGALPDWDAVVAGSGLKRERARRRRLTAGAALVVAASVIGLATPLGAAIARGLDGFSAWITGEPGSPASSQQQRYFDRANARSWVAFPQGTKLRHLITQHVDNTTVELLGFRSGTSTLCLRLIVEGRSRTSTQSCAPLAALRLAGAPVRVFLIDQPVGKGKKRAWYGIDHVGSANLQITAGVAADGVQTVTLEDEHGRHDVPARSNAFLYVAPAPEVGQRVSSISARTATGTVPVPFSPSPFGLGGFSSPPSTTPTVPIERKVTGGKVGWLERQESRGRPLSVLPRRMRISLLGARRFQRRSRIVFGRVVTPDPTIPTRMVLTLNAHHAGGPAAGLCTAVVGPSGGGSGCAPYPGLFKASPVSVGVTGSGPGEFVLLGGVASDDVDHLRALLSGGQMSPVPLVDNAFLVHVSRSNLPARIVGYDRSDKVIGVSYPLQDFMGNRNGPARGRAVELLHATGPKGAHSELLVGKATGGGECVYVRDFIDKRHAGVSVSCQGLTWRGPSLQLSAGWNPPLFVSGRVRNDVASVRLRFADGSTSTLRPTRGYVLQAMAPGHLKPGHEVIAADGFARNGRRVGHESLRPGLPVRGSG